MMANDGNIAEDTLFGPERPAARAIDWDQSDRGLSSGRVASVLQSRRRIHDRNRNYASFNRKVLALREPPIHGPSDNGRSPSAPSGGRFCGAGPASRRSAGRHDKATTTQGAAPTRRTRAALPCAAGRGASAPAPAPPVAIRLPYACRHEKKPPKPGAFLARPMRRGLTSPRGAPDGISRAASSPPAAGPRWRCLR